MLEIMRENASGWIVKVLFAIIIVVFVFAFGMSGFDSGQDPVMATVNDQIITRAEFEDAFQRAAEGMRKANPSVTSEQLQSPEFKRAVLNDLINNRLLLAEAANLGISASDEEVFAAITRQQAFWNGDGKFDPSIYKQVVRSIRMTPAQFEARFKQDMIASKIRDMVSKTAEATPAQARQLYDWIGEEIKVDYILTPADKFLDKVEVSDKEVSDFYAANEAKFMVPKQVRLRYISFTPEDLAAYQQVSDDEINAYYEANKDSMRQEEQVKARHILVKMSDDDTDDAKKAARAKIDDIYKKATSGADFAKLAEEYSEGPSATNGGELGWFTRGAMVPEFEEAAFATPKGTVSEPIKTQFGWHIILVEDHTEEQSKSLVDMTDEIRKILAEEKASELVSDLLDQAMDRLVSGMSVEAVGKELGLTPVTTDKVQERFLPQMFGMTPEAAKVVMDLPTGKVNQTPLSIDGGYIIVEKVEDIEAAPMKLDDVKPAIMATLSRQNASELAKTAAQDILDKLKADPAAADAYKDAIKTSEAFGRQGFVPELGQSRELSEAAFAAKGNAWLPEVYTTSLGMVVARLNERIPASEITWEEQKDGWIAQVSRSYEQEAITAFMDGLRESATIDIARPDLLN